jgi:hypothetical protein
MGGGAVKPEQLVPIVSLRFAFAVANRPELVACLGFVEGAATWDERALLDWLEAHVVAPGILPRPRSIWERGQKAVTLRANAPASAVRELLASARAQVVQAMRGLIAVPAADAFVNGAIFAGRVTREAVGSRSVWRATPRASDALSDVVLSLAVVDILAHREFYEQHLNVCAACGRLSFEAGAVARTGCPAHPPISGVQDAGGSRRTLGAPGGAAMVDEELADLEAINTLRSSFGEELRRALRDRSAWSCVGAVTVAAPDGQETLGGHVDRRSIAWDLAASPEQAIEGWRRTE